MAVNDALDIPEQRGCHGLALALGQLGAEMNGGIGFDKVNRCLIQRLLLRFRVFVAGIDQATAGLLQQALRDQPLLGQRVSKKG